MSTTLGLARGVFTIIGAGALLMSIGGLTSGESLSDPVFPAGLALGALSLGAAAWVESPGLARAVVTWLGLLAALVGVVVFGSMVVRTPALDTFALFAVPALIVVLAAFRLAAARVRAGAMG